MHVATSQNLARPDTHGFTLIELVVVISVLAILAAVALPRLVTVSEESHTANAQGTSAAFEAGASIVHGKWLSQGGGASVPTEGGGTVSVNTLGWPGRDLPPGLTQAECRDVFTEVLQDGLTVDPGYTPFTPGWGALSGGVLCAWIYERDISPLRLILYNSATGVTQFLVI